MHGGNSDVKAAQPRNGIHKVFTVLKCVTLMEQLSSINSISV